MSMGSQSRWGLTLPLSGLSLAAHKDLVAGLPELGYTDVWSAELNGIDGFTPLTLASQWAPELRLGTAIVGIYTRAPVSLRARRPPPPPPRTPKCRGGSPAPRPGPPARRKRASRSRSPTSARGT